MALPDLPISGTVNFESNLRTNLDVWKDSIETRSALDHSHSGTTLNLTIAAGSGSDNLPTVTTDGELGITTGDHFLYIGDSGVSTWLRVQTDIIELQIFN